MMDYINLFGGIVSIMMCLGLALMLVELKQKVANDKRFKFWRILIVFLIGLSAKLGLKVLGVIPLWLDILLMILMIVPFTIWIFRYVNNMYINSKWMKSAGLSVEDSAFFDIVGFVVNLMVVKVIRMANMEIRLLDFTGNELHMSVEALSAIEFPWQFHFGVEFFKVLVGRIMIRNKWLDAGETMKAEDLQSHRLKADKGALFESRIVFNKWQMEIIGAALAKLEVECAESNE